MRKGFATVTMPAWFEALNEDFRYQLTTVGQFAQCDGGQQKMKDGKFTIRTNKPNVEISWQVTGSAARCVGERAPDSDRRRKAGE